MTNPTPTPAEIAEIIAEVKDAERAFLSCKCTIAPCPHKFELDGLVQRRLPALLAAASRGIAPESGEVQELVERIDNVIGSEGLSPLHLLVRDWPEIRSLLLRLSAQPQSAAVGVERYPVDSFECASCAESGAMHPVCEDCFDRIVLGEDRAAEVRAEKRATVEAQPEGEVAAMLKEADALHEAMLDISHNLMKESCGIGSMDAADAETAAEKMLDAGDMLGRLSRSLGESERKRREAEAENIALRKDVREWCCDGCNWVFPGFPDGDGGPLMRYLCKRCGGMLMPHHSVELKRSEANTRDALRRKEAAEARVRELEGALRKAWDFMPASRCGDCIARQIEPKLAKKYCDFHSVALSCSPAAAPEAPQMPECAWTEDENEGYWESDCGGDPWSFNDGGPVENKMKHCHKCGRIIQAAAVDGQDAKPSRAAGDGKS